MVCGKLNSNAAIEEFVLYSAAPLDTAVKLSRALGLAALREKERSMDLLNAARYCEGIAAELLTVASGGKSAAAILRALDHRGASVLDCLIEGQQKAVVAHPAVQKYLSKVWCGSLRWASWKMPLLFFCLLVCPPLWLAVSLPLRHNFNTVPIVKFMSHLVSHIFLLCLFILSIVYPPVNPVYLGRLLPGWSEWLLLAWLSGMLVSELTQPGERAGMAWIRVLVLGFSAVGFFCHLLAFAFPAPDRLHCLFARNIFLAVAMTLSFVQLLEFLTFHHLFGPWAIIIRDLMKDLGRFTVILVLFHTAFTMNLSAVYQPVYPPDPSTGGNGTETQTPLDISIQLFFALFGLIKPDSMPPLGRSPPFAGVVTHVVFGIYLVVTVIVLVNLLIAMMSDTYQRIQAQSDTEWKFGRAVLIRDMNRKSGTPSPFNLFTHLFFYIKMLCKHGAVVEEPGEPRTSDASCRESPRNKDQGACFGSNQEKRANGFPFSTTTPTDFALETRKHFQQRNQKTLKRAPRKATSAICHSGAQRGAAPAQERGTGGTAEVFPTGLRADPPGQKRGAGDDHGGEGSDPQLGRWGAGPGHEGRSATGGAREVVAP